MIIIGCDHEPKMQFASQKFLCGNFWDANATVFKVPDGLACVTGASH